MQSQLLVILATQVVDNTLNHGRKKCFLGNILKSFFKIRIFLLLLLDQRLRVSYNHLKETHF